MCTNSLGICLSWPQKKVFTPKACNRTKSLCSGRYYEYYELPKNPQKVQAFFLIRVQGKTRIFIVDGPRHALCCCPVELG